MDSSDQKKNRRRQILGLSLNLALLAFLFFSGLSTYFLVMILVLLNAFLYFPSTFRWWRYSLITGLGLVLFMVLGDRLGAKYGAEFLLILLMVGLVLGLRDRYLASRQWFPSKFVFDSRKILVWCVGAIGLVLVLALRMVLIDRGVILAGDFNMPIDIAALAPEKFMSLWGTSGSYPEISHINDYLFFLILSSVAKFFSWSVLVFQKIMFLVPLLIAGMGSFSFFRYIGRKLLFRAESNQRVFLVGLTALAAVFYAVNPWSMGLVGHYFHWLSYAILPLILWMFFKSWDCPARSFLLWTVLIGALVAIFISSPHFLFYLFLILTLAFVSKLIISVSERRWARAGQIIWRSIIVGVVVLTLCAYWLVPIWQSWSQAESLPTPNYFWRMEDVSAAQKNTSIWHPISLGTSSNATNLVGIIFGLYCVGGIIWSLFNKSRLKAGALFLFSVLLVGVGEVAAFIYWPDLFFRIFSRVSFGWILRDPTRIASLLPLVYGIGFILMTYAITSALAKLRFSKWVGQSFLGAVFFACSLAVALFSLPYLSENFDKKYIPSPLPEEYQQVLQKIRADYGNPGKVAWYPAQFQAQSLTWLPGKKIDNFVNSSSVRPSFSGQTDYSRFMLKYIETNWANLPFYNDLLGVSDTVVRKDLPDSAEIASPSITAALSADSNFQKIFSGDILDVYRSQKIQPTIQAKNCLVSIMGGLEVLPSLLRQPETSSERCGFAFLDQIARPDQISQLVAASDLILFNESIDEDRLSLKLIPDRLAVYPAKFTSHGDPKNYWTQASTTDPLHGEWHKEMNNRGMFNWDFDSGQGIIYASEPTGKKNQIIKIDIPNSSAGADLYVRVFQNRSGGTIKFRSGHINLGEYHAAGPENSFVWVKAASLPENFDHNFIEIINWSGFNALEAVKIVSPSDFEEARQKARDLIKGRPVGITHHLEPTDYLEGWHINLPSLSRLSLDFSGNQESPPRPFLSTRRKVSPIELDGNAYYARDLIGNVSLKFPEIDLRSLAGTNQSSAPTDFYEVSSETDYLISLKVSARDVDNFSAKIYEYADPNEKPLVGHSLFERISGDLETKKYYRRFKTRSNTRYLKIAYVQTNSSPEVAWEVRNVVLVTGQQYDSLANKFYGLTVIPENFLAEFRQADSDQSVYYSADQNLDQYQIEIPGEAKILVLRESFDDGWVLSSEDNGENHFPVYGLFSGYLLQSSRPSTSVWEYRPTRYLRQGYWVTAGAGAGWLLIGLAVYGVTRRSRLNRKKPDGQD